MNEAIIYILVMAGVTYLIRVLPLVLIRGRITNGFVRSFLYYVPFVTLAVMIFPSILHSTDHVESAAVGLAAAVLFALYKGGLIQVSLLACSAVFIVERVMG